MAAILKEGTSCPSAILIKGITTLYPVKVEQEHISQEEGVEAEGVSQVETTEHGGKCDRPPTEEQSTIQVPQAIVGLGSKMEV